MDCHVIVLMWIKFGTMLLKFSRRASVDDFCRKLIDPLCACYMVFIRVKRFLFNGEDYYWKVSMDKRSVIAKVLSHLQLSMPNNSERFMNHQLGRHFPLTLHFHPRFQLATT